MRQTSFSRADVITLTVVLLAMVTASFGQVDASRELANRATCAANLRGIVQSMVVYAADSSDSYPCLAPSSATTYDVTFKEAPAGKIPEAALDSLYKEKKYPNNPTANLWIMVMTGQVAAKQFICKSDLFALPAAITNNAGEFYTNFQDGKNFSYSSAYPWTEKNGKTVISGLWRNQMDASLPVLCDMAPFFGRAAADNPSPSPAGVNEQWAVTHANSANHQYDGQNVVYSDAHAEFQRLPIVGQSNDSLWGTRRIPQKPEDRSEQFIAAGTLPHVLGGATGDWDVVMVPTRDTLGNLK